MQFLLFIAGALAGGLGTYFLRKEDPSAWRQRRAQVWGKVAVGLLLSFVLSYLLGAELLIAAAIVIVYATYASFKYDTENSVATAERSIAVTELLSSAIVNAAARQLRNLGLIAEKQPVKPRASVARPVATAPASGDQNKATELKADPASPGLSEEAALQQLLVEIGRLQQWTARPEAERATLVQLAADVRNTETVLNAAVLQLKNGTVDWHKICGHVEGLKQHDLPEDLARSLDALVADRAGKLDETRKTVGEVSGKLRGSTGELKQHLDKPVQSPEELIDAANNAIRAAEELSAGKR